MNQTQQGYPFAFLQKRIWSLQQEGHALSVKGMLELEGPVEAGRLRQALHEVVNRHEILRTHYHTPPAFSYPWQVVAGRGTLAFETRETSGREPGEQAAAIDHCWQSLLPADVSREENPVVSAVLLKLSPRRHRFLLCLPALAADAASLHVLFAEVLRTYWGDAPAEDPLQYCQFSEWVNDLGTDPGQADRRAWQQYDLLPSPPNPFGWAGETPPARADDHPIRHRLPLPAPLAAALGGYAGDLDAPLPVLLLAYWHVVIQRHAAAERNVTGLVLNHRTYDELQSLVGPVVNTVPVASVITPDTTFPELVRQLGAEADRAAGWQESFSWDHLPGAHGPEGRLPRFSCGFEWVEAALDVAVPPGFACRYADFAGTPDLFDVRLCVLRNGDGLQLDLYGDPRSVSGAALAALGDQLLTVLGHAFTRQPVRVAALNLLSPAAADQIRNRFSANPVAPPPECSLPEAFRARAARHPDYTAVRAGTASLTYCALDERSDRLAAFLAGTRAVGPGDLVGVMTYRSEWAVVTLLAVLKTGAAYVPLDPGYPSERIGLLLRESTPKVLLAEDAALLDRHGMAGPEAIPLREAWPAVAGYPGPRPAPHHAAADLAYVMYTSGSTGTPKGVEIRMGSLMNYLAWANAHYFGNEPGTPFGLFTSLSFDLSVTGLFGPLLRGDMVVLYGHGAVDETLAEVFGENSPVRAVKMTPSHISLLRHLPLGRTPVRCVVVGGEALLPEHVRTLRQLNPGVSIYNEYGPTETTVGCTVKQIGGGAERVTIGTPAGNARIFVLGEADALQPVGVAGEICIGGAGVARGYRNRPAQTHEKFVPYPSHLGEAGVMYRSGDLGRWLPNGELQYLGRNDNQVKIKGFRVEPAEIERAVLGFPGVVAATVAVRHDEDGAPYLAAYWVGGDITDASLREHLDRHLPGYLVPAYLVRLDALHYTVNGKVDARALPDPHLARAAADAYEAPGNPLEAQLAEVIGAVLHHDRPGIGDSFFDLGIDSIKAIQIASRLHKAGLKVEVKEILRYPRIKDLAPLVRQENVRAAHPVGTGPVALAPAQSDFFRTVRVAPHHYNQSVLLRADDLTEGRVREAFAALLEHHDALRTVFHCEGELIRQECRPPGEAVSLAVWDLRGEADPAAALAERATALQASLHLETGPLVKPALIGLPEGQRLLIVAHHLVVDGVSWRILLEDLAGLLRGLPLPPKTDAYLHWAERMAAHAQNPAVLAERPYWLALDESLPDPSFAGTPSATCQLGGLRTVAFTLDPGQAHLLPRANAAFSTNTQDLLLAALGTALRETFGISRPFVMVEGHGRETTLPDLNVSRTVGWFTSEYPVRWSAGAPTGPLAELIACKEALRQVPAGGVHYRLLQALPAPATGGDAIFRPKPPVRFNYLGSIGDGPGNDLFSFAEESVGKQRDPGQAVEYPLEISGLEDASGLTLSVTYHPALTDPDRVGQLCRACEAALRQLVALCVAGPAGQVTPSDLTLGGLPLPVVQSLATRYAVEDVLPLTATQEGMLFQKLLDETSHVYFQQLSYRSLAAWDPSLVQRALDVLFERHAALRAAFVHDGWDRPLQVIRKRQPADFHYEDLRYLPDPSARAQYLRQYRSRDVARSFRLDADALLRVALFRTGEEAYEFVWSNHHIVLDGWSMSILTTEFAALYGHLRQNRPLRLSTPAPYARYFGWLRDRDREASRAYWQDYLRGYAEPARLPVAAPGPYANLVKGRETLHLDPETTRRLQAVALRHSVTLNTLVNTLWGVLLAWYNDHRDVVFGSLSAGRPAAIPGIETMVGLFINTIPVRIRYQADASFEELLRQVQDDALRSEPHQYYPLADIEAAPAWGAALFNHLVIFENYPDPDQLLAGSGPAEALPPMTDPEEFDDNNYPFTLLVSLRGAALQFRFDFGDGVRGEVAALRERLRRLIDQVTAPQPVRLREIDFLTGPERAQVLDAFNQTAAPIPAETTVCSLFERRAAGQPEAIAVRCGSRSLTYGVLNATANRLAHHLREAYGVGPGKTVGLLLTRSEYVPVAILGVLKAGGAYLPVDPAYPRERIGYCLSDARVGLLLTESGLVLDAIEYFGGDLFAVDAQLPDLAGSTDDPEPGCSPGDLAYVMYTSGSTGVPKGVCVAHGGVANLALAQCESAGIRADDRIYQFASLSFDASVSEIFMALCAGAALVMSGEEIIRDKQRFLAHLRETGTTVITLPPAFMRLFAAEELDFLRVILTAGEAADVRLAAALSSSVRVLNAYGPTECTVCATMYEVGPGDAGRVSIPIGRPIANARVYVLDHAGRPVPPGMAGEIWVAGAGVARGYLHHDELTARKFIPSPFVAGERLYGTGDLGQWLPDGNLVYLGRRDAQLKVRGHRVEGAEIEHHLLAPPVSQAVVHKYAGPDGQEHLLAFLVADQPLDLPLVREALKGRLPAFMVPDALVQVAAIPLTPNGKTDYAALREAWLAEASPRGGGRLPATEAERKLAAIWEAVLGRTGLTLDDNFFDLGGHSLKAIQVLSRMEREWQVGFDLKTLFAHPTIGSLAAQVDAGRGAPAGATAIPRVAAQPFYDVSPAQKRLWIMHQLQGGLTAYNLPVAYQLDGPLRVPALAHAFRVLVERHEILRTTFVTAGGEPKQRIHAPGPDWYALHEADLTGHADAVARAGAIAGQEAAHAFNLSEGPLVRATLLRLAPHRHVFLLTMHHLVADERSLEVIFRQLSESYNACCKGHAGPPAELPVQYKDYVAWQGQQLTARMPELRAHWLEHFAGALRPLPLPADCPRPAAKTYDGGHVESFLPPALLGELLTLGQQHQASLFMLLLSAVNVLLHRYAEGEPVTVGTPAAGRTHLDLEDQVGFYVNTLAIRNRFLPGQPFSDALGQVRQRTLAAYAHQLYPFDELVDSLSYPRDASRNPLFDVWMVLHNPPPAQEPMGKIAVTRFGPPSSVVHFDLSFDFLHQDGGLLVVLRYNRDLFGTPRAAFLNQCLVTVLEKIARNPGATVAELLAAPEALPAAQNVDLSLEMNWK